MVVLGKKRALSSLIEEEKPSEKISKVSTRKFVVLTDDGTKGIVKQKRSAQCRSRVTSVHEVREEQEVKKSDVENGEIIKKRAASDDIARIFRQGDPEDVLRALDQVAGFLYTSTTALPPHLRVGRQDKFQGLSGSVKFKRSKKPKAVLDNEAITPLVLHFVNPQEDEAKDSEKSSGNYQKTLGELEEKLNELKGKRASYREKLLKKKLKNKIKKKQKAEKRKRTKEINKTVDTKVEPNEEIVIPKKEENANDIVFSKFNFSSEHVEQKPREDPKRSLQKLEKTKDLLKKLISSGKEDKANEIMTKNKWKSAMMKAEGVKIRDNEELLKKSIKKKAQLKAKSKKKWDERNELLKKKMGDAQVKRKENLDKRKKQIKNVKIKRAVKKGRLLPS